MSCYRAKLFRSLFFSIAEGPEFSGPGTVPAKFWLYAVLTGTALPELAMQAGFSSANNSAGVPYIKHHGTEHYSGQIEKVLEDLIFAAACSSGINQMSAKNKALISLVPHITHIKILAHL